MGLIYWLPMTDGTAKNQGLVNDVFTTSGPTANTSGKLGSCCYFNGSTHSIYTNREFDYPQTTISCWFKISTDNSVSGSQWLICFNSSGSGTAANTLTGFYITTEIKLACQSRGRTYTYGTALSKDVWYHVCATSENGETMKVYINGELVGEDTVAGTAVTATCLSIGGRATNSSGTVHAYCPTGMYMNDVRIYDDILSPREIKEISKGLVLHYPLAMPGGENLLKNSLTNFPQLWSGSGDGSTLTTQSGVSVPEWGCNDGLRVYGKSGASNALCLLINNSTHGLTVPSTSVSGQKYTPSIYIKNNHQNAINIAFNGIATGQFINQGEIKKVILKATGNGTQMLQFTISASGVNKEYDFTFWHPKIELGEVCTPWVPATTDSLYSAMGLDNNIEYDCSGYKNNGTKGGTITYTSDTPRYSTATNFAASSGIFAHPNITFSSFTIAFWGKHVATGKMLMGSLASLTNTNAYWYWYGDNSFKYPSGEFYYAHNAGTAEELLGKWTYFVATYDGSVITVYRNGINEGTKALTGTQILEYLSVGCGYTGSSYWAGGCVSDFRIYATALSADDVMTLYHTPISLANNGTLLTQGEYVES